jgi:hypothetical protein
MPLTAPMRRLAVPATLAAVVIFVIASLRGGRFLYAASLLTFAVGLAGFLALPAPRAARWPRLFHLGLALALAAALADGLLDLANAIGTATNITTIGIIVGLALAFIGRVRSRTTP